MTVIESMVLGAVQGITEFLPVSSSGHLQLAKELLGVHIADNLTFDVALHAGTVCSTLVILWGTIAKLLRGIFRGVAERRVNEQVNYALMIILSMVPVAIVGFTCKEYLEQILNSSYSLYVVGAMLLITSALLWFAHNTKSNNEGAKIGYKEAFIIGLAQAVAVLPGISRSGATIATGIILGRDRSEVAQFSFLMVLVPILGNTLLDLIKGGGEIAIEGVTGGVLFAGFITSFVVGALACKAMIEIVKRGKLSYFAIYCAVAGVAAIVATLLR